MTAVEVHGIGFWSLGFADAAAFAAGRPDEAVTAPSPTLGSKRHLRYTSDVTKMAIAACEQSIAGSDLELTDLNVIFASSQGEIQIAVELLDRIASGEGASPARFMNSVHNTVCGHLSIASKSHGAFSALAGSRQTVSGALIEAFALLKTRDCESVVLVLGDESLPAPVDVARYDSLAAALFLRAGDGNGGSAEISAVVRDESVRPFVAPPELAENPCAPVLGVLAALAENRAGLVRLDGEGDEGWCAELSFR